MVPKWFPLVPIGSLSLIFRAPILTLNPGGLGHSPWPTICRGEFHWWCTRPVRGASRWINPVEKVATNWLRFRRVQESISSQLMSVISQIISLSLFMSIYLPAVPTTLPISLSIQIQSTSIHLYLPFISMSSLCRSEFMSTFICLSRSSYFKIRLSVCLSVSISISIYLSPSSIMFYLYINIWFDVSGILKDPGFPTCLWKDCGVGEHTETSNPAAWAEGTTWNNSDRGGYSHVAQCELMLCYYVSCLTP
jgi:hypothetical protein